MRALRADIGHPTARLTLLSARYRGLRWCRAQRAPEQANSNKVIPRNTTRPCTHKPFAMSALRRYRPPLRSRSKWRDGPRGDIAASACDVRNVPIRPVAVTAPFFDCPGITDEIYDGPCLLFVERPTPCARSHANQSAEDSREVALIAEAARQGHIG